MGDDDNIVIQKSPSHTNESGFAERDLGKGERPINAEMELGSKYEYSVRVR